MKSSELYDVIPESWATPIAAQKPLEDAYQIDVSLRVISRIQNELIDPSVLSALRSNQRRSNPAADVQSAAASIRSLLKVDEIPKTLKLASRMVSKIASGREIGRLNQELADAYAKLKESLTFDFAVSVATSYANLAQAQGSQVNVGVVAQIIAARWGYFSDTITLENSGNFSFEALSSRQQDFIEVLIFGTYSLVDLNDEDIATALDVDAYCIALSTFPNDKVLYELFSRLAGDSTEIEDFVLAESRPQSYAKANPNHIGPHYATPYIYALAIASKLNSDVSSWTRPSKNFQAFISDPYTFVQGDMLDSKGLNQICQNAQTNNFTDALIRIATATLIEKADSARVLKSPSLKTLLDARGLVRKEGETIVSKPVELIAGLAMAVGSDTDVANGIFASNLGNITAQKLLSNITQKLGQPVEALPSVAYEYATASNIGGRTYFEWAFDLVQAYTEIKMKGFSSSSAKFATEGVRKLSSDLSLRKTEIPKLLKVLAQFKTSGLLADSSLNHPANPQSDENAVDWSSLHSYSGDRQIAIAAPVIQAVNSANCEEIFNLVFQNQTVDIANPLQCIVLAAAFYVDNNKPNAKRLAFENLPTTVSMNEVYVSSSENPLTLFMGQETFYNCCLTSYREATSAVCASFFTQKYKILGAFEFGAENKLNDPIVCTALTTLVWSEVTGSNVYVDQRNQASIAFEPTEISLKICSPNLTKISKAFTKNPNATLQGWLVGGGEKTSEGQVGLSDAVIEKGTSDLVSAVLNPSTKFGQDLLGGNCHGHSNSHMKSQSERVGLSLTKSFFGGEADEEKFNNSNISNAKTLSNAYNEASRGTIAFCSTVLGQQKVSVASSNFKSLDVYFEDLATDDQITCVYTTTSGQKLTLDLEFQNNTSAGDILRYMFSFPKGETFIPFEGSVTFHTSRANMDVCKKLLIPDWFFGKPLRINDITYSSDDLVDMRTPKKGAFLVAEETGKKSKLF